MEDFWLEKFDELAKFNADSDKSKYIETYLDKMDRMQAEYNARLLMFAKTNNYVVYV